MADSPAPKRALVRRLWGVIMFLAVAAALASSAYLFLRLKREESARAALAAEVAAFGPRFEQFKGAVRDVNRQLTSNVFHQVDLATRAGSFRRRLLHHRHLGYRRRQGDAHRRQIVNPTSVVHESASSHSASTKAGDVRAAQGSPGLAQPFEVTLPDIAPGAAHKAFIALENSTIKFASSTTSKRTGSDPRRHRQTTQMT